MAKLTDEQKKARATQRKIDAESKKEAEIQERVRNRLNDELIELRFKHPKSTPRYSYTVGEEVLPRTANWDNLIIKEILDEGRVLLCLIHSTENNYGKPLPVTNLRYVSHLEVIPKNLPLKPTISSREKRQISFNNTMIFSLLGMHYRSKIDYSPIYQRELVWTLKDKQSLIHSIFNNVEIGKFAFIDRKYEKDGPSYEILDGKQRMNALIEFYEDGFDYNGIFFSEMSIADKHYFTNYNVTYGRGSEDWTLSDKMKYFLKMNVTGIPQSEEHIKHVTDLLEKELKRT